MENFQRASFITNILHIFFQRISNAFHESISIHFPQMKWELIKW